MRGPRGRSAFPPGLHPEACAEVATAGPLLVAFFVNSVVRVTATSVASATQSLGPFPGGTQIEIAVTDIQR